jgi:hypothetical protein
VEDPEPTEEAHETPPRDTDSHGSRRHRPRHSGGFLLESVFTPSAKRHSDGLIFLKHKADDKGKRKSEDGGLIVPKRRATHHHHRPKQSIGSSPLAIEQTQVLQGTAPPKGSEGAGLDGTTEPHVNGNGRKKTIKLDDAPSPHHHSRPNQRGQRASVPGIGFDTDPAQIVNLALNLSENRRRTISSGRFGPDSPRRIVSSGSASNGPADALNYVRQGGSLRQHLMQQRKMSRNISPSSTPVRKASMASPRLNGQTQRRSSKAVSNAIPDEASDEEIEYEISESTLARAAKARQHFELFYEYRRLISILPPLRHAPSKAPAADSEDVESYEPGRIYNPLQYIRNRKLRWREKSPLWSEADGWNDADKVRPWLDKVADDHKEPTNDPDECIRLPQLQDERHEPEEDSSPASDLRRPATNVSQKPRRPRMDWIISPPDLLADSFWLEQGLNKTKIEDRDGNKLYPRDAQLKFTGWRTRTPGILPVSSNESANVSADKLKSPPELPTFRSHSINRSERMGRGRKKHHLRDSIHTLSHSHSGSRDRPSRLLKVLTKSDSASSSSDSEAEGFRGRKKRIRNILDQDSEAISNAALEKQMLAMLEQDTVEDSSSSSLKKRQPSLNRDDTKQPTPYEFPSKEPSGEGVIFKSDVFKERNRSLPSMNKSKPVAVSSVRSSVEQERTRHSFEEMDSTAPNSPTANGFVPSIAINLSPPSSRSPSPTKKHLPARLFRADRSKSKQRHGISAEDFAVAVEENQERQGRSSAEAHRPNRHREGTSSPKTKRPSLTTEDTGPVDLRRTQSAQVKGSKPVPQPDSRIRGIFKGGRIAEIVGNEVSRVGDFIWKRDAPHHARAPSSASSIVSEESSPEYGVVGDGLTTPKAIPNASVRRITTAASEAERLSRKPTEKEAPKYHTSNLPTFRSPFKQEDQDGDVFKHPLASPQGDHISRQQVARRETSRHGRFERLAPPRIDIRDVSPGDSDTYEPNRWPGAERRDSYGFGQAMSANKRLNDALNNEGIVILDRPPVTGLASLDVSHAPSNRKPRIRDKRDWSISQRSMSTSREAPINRRDIARVRALLLSNGVKATEISRRSRLVRDPPPPWLLQIAKDANETLPPTSRKDEHVYAARILVREIDLGHSSHQEALEEFSNVTVPRLYGRLHDLDDLVSNSLTLRARSAGDDAGSQSAQLTTTRTLAVKQLNDGIDLVIRSRRRRLRWARRMGYFMLEWTVLGLMWWVWLVVMIYQFVKGSAMVVVRSVRWMLFL